MAMAVLEMTPEGSHQDLQVSKSTLYSLMRSDTAFGKAQDRTIAHLQTRFEAKGIVFGEDGSAKLQDKPLPT